MERQGYLINTTTPSLVKSNEFGVANQAFRLTAMGLVDVNDKILIHIWVGDEVNGGYAPLFMNGAQVTLNGVNNIQVIAITGRYKVTYAGLSTVACYYDTDDLSLDTKLFYNLVIGTDS